MYNAVLAENKIIKGKDAEDTVTIYRATIGGTIRPDDYVALNRDVAEMELQNVIDRGDVGAKIIQQEVKMKDLLMANDATEFVYSPMDNNPQFSRGENINADTLAKQIEDELGLER
jgi:hypothetical protein